MPLSTPMNIPARQRIAGIDELRGFGILWILWCHSTGLWTWVPKEFGGYGYHGVVLYFVCCGFIITRLLVDDSAKQNFFSTFYINRFFRIWPLMLLAMLVSAILWHDKAFLAVFNLLMINNYAHAYGINEMVRTDVLWSIAIEWQFYIVWPAIIYLVNPKWLPWLCSGIIFLGLGFDAGLLASKNNVMATHEAMQYIAMGALVAINRGKIHYLLIAWGAFFLLYLSKNSIADFRWFWYGISFAFGLLVHATVHWRPIVLAKALAWVGRHCYGLYVIHFFVSWFVMEYFGKGEWMQGGHILF